VVCTFRHRRADGLGRCLLEASKAVERQRWAEAERILDIANPGHHDGAAPAPSVDGVVQCPNHKEE